MDSSKYDSMSYIYIAHRIFCSFFSAVSHEVYASNFDMSVCYVPFHTSKISLTPGVPQISLEFMQDKRLLFRDDHLIVPNMFMFNELSSATRWRASAWQRGGGGGWTEERERRDVGRRSCKSISAHIGSRHTVHVGIQQCCTYRIIAARMQWKHACFDTW